MFLLRLILVKGVGSQWMRVSSTEATGGLFRRSVSGSGRPITDMMTFDFNDFYYTRPYLWSP